MRLRHIGDINSGSTRFEQMIGRNQPLAEPEETEPKRFDDFDLCLGDMMRGERATMGKSLLDVQRDLKIKATYIAAIENADISAFETPGFIAGYVRSYARYLKMDPEWAYQTFCREADYTPQTGFDPVGSMGSGPKGSVPIATPHISDSIFESAVLGGPRNDSFFSRIEPGAIGSSLVLLALIAAIGYGGWAVFREIQQVQVTPVEQVPGVAAAVDPLDSATAAVEVSSDLPNFSATRPEAFDRLYRPEALDVPVMVARDGPIATIDPSRSGVLPHEEHPYDRLVAGTPSSGELPIGPEDAVTQQVLDAMAMGPSLPDRPQPKVLAENAPEVMLVAVRDAWIRVRAADGSTIYERTMSAGDTYVLPQTENPATLRTGAAGSVYFMVNGEAHGPAGGAGQVVDNIALDASLLSESYAKVDPTVDGDGQRAVEVAEAALAVQEDPQN
ncbi:MAG: helix-turn-helix domain-containing protein [Pseudomonadota bacterium]